MSSLASFYKVASYIDNVVLAATVAETITKPAAGANVYNVCVLTTNADVWIRRGGTAAEPAADVTDGTGSILIPAGTSRIVDFRDDGGSVLASVSVISASAARMSLEWFR